MSSAPAHAGVASLLVRLMRTEKSPPAGWETAGSCQCSRTGCSSAVNSRGAVSPLPAPSEQERRSRSPAGATVHMTMVTFQLGRSSAAAAFSQAIWDQAHHVLGGTHPPPADDQRQATAPAHPEKLPGPQHDEP